MSADFIHFRVQSSYSMLESALKIPELISLAKENEMPAICLADRGNLFASLEFALEAKKKSVQPIHGSILRLAFPYKGQVIFGDVLLIAKDEDGYQNLLHLVSSSFTREDRSLGEYITLEELQQNNQGLILLSGYIDGVIGKLLLRDDVNGAIEASKKLLELFGDRFYFEIMRGVYEREAEIEPIYLDIAYNLDIALIATNQVLFTNVNMHEAHDVLLCIAEGVKQVVADRKRVSNQCYFKSPREMRERFADLPEALENTIYLMQRCAVMAQSREPSLPNFINNDEPEENLLRLEVKEGLKKRLISDEIKNEQEYWDRLEYELDIICKMNFSGYFLIVSDFIKASKSKGIAVGPGRGSGAGSIVAWALEITDLDPIKFGLLFERFLNPERISMPDFDIDFCQERRDEVISYVRSKYGDDRVAQIITFGKMQAKAVIKDVARVLGLGFFEANYISNLVPFNAVNPVTLRQAIDQIPELKSAYEGRGLYGIQSRGGSGEDDNKSKKPSTKTIVVNTASDGLTQEQLIEQVLKTSLVLEGLHRHASVHAAGIVIANKKLSSSIPVYKDPKMDMLIVQYSMKYAELAGLVKFDFLGLQTLTLISKTLELLAKNGIELDIKSVPYDDAKTYQLLAKGLSNGVFQFESVGMKNALRKLVPDSLDDLIALGALYRPGPMDNIPTYIACKHGLQDPDYLHPVLEPILRSTYGVIIYQEQVMEIAKTLAGYSLGAADLLRRAMGKKVKAEMDAQEEMFIQGALHNNVSPEQAKSIFATVAKFAGYGFNKSHASAYAVISYYTAYLKANHTAEFLVAFLNLELNNSEKLSLFVQEAKEFNINILPPDINQSEGRFTILYDQEGKATIRFALGALKKVTSNFGEIVVLERLKRGEFKSISDFVRRMEHKLVNKLLLKNLINAGCFDSLHNNRKELFENVEGKIAAYQASCHDRQNQAQLSFIPLEEPVLDKYDDYSDIEKATAEFDVLGMFISSHPLLAFKEYLQQYNVTPASYVKNSLRDGNHNNIQLAGVIIKKDTRMSQRGRFITLLISDLDGTLEVTIYSDEVLKSAAHLLEVKSIVLITADVNKDSGALRITANRVGDLTKQNDIMNCAIIPKIKIQLPDNASIEMLKKILLESNSDYQKYQQANSIYKPTEIWLYMKSYANFIIKLSLGENFFLTKKAAQDIQDKIQHSKIELF